MRKSVPGLSENSKGGVQETKKIQIIVHHHLFLFMLNHSIMNEGGFLEVGKSINCLYGGGS